MFVYIYIHNYIYIQIYLYGRKEGWMDGWIEVYVHVCVCHVMYINIDEGSTSRNDSICQQNWSFRVL